MNRTHVFLFALLLTMSVGLQAQSWADRPLEISVLQQSSTLAPNRLVSGPLHPGLMIGTEFSLKENPNSTFALGANIGYWRHKSVQHMGFANAELRYRHHFSSGTQVGAFVGLGYGHTFWDGMLYEQEIDGSWSEINQRGRPHLLGSIGAEVNQKIGGQNAIFLRYQLMVETPFANGYPIFPHSVLQVGLRFFPFQ
ncbi:MAG: hypothetical protein AAF206_29500 [Bacteroidota bacterium]